MFKPTTKHMPNVIQGDCQAKRAVSFFLYVRPTSAYLRRTDAHTRESETPIKHLRSLAPISEIASTRHASPATLSSLRAHKVGLCLPLPFTAMGSICGVLLCGLLCAL